MNPRGLTLVEVIMAFWLLLATIVMASAILHQTMRHLRQQEHTTRGAFLAQGKLEEFMRVPSSRLVPAQGRFEEPFRSYGWNLTVEARDDFWELRMDVDGPSQSHASVLAQRRIEPRVLWFAGNRDGPSQLYRINENGTELKRMTRTSTTESQPALSPDGTEVAFVSNRSGHAQIFVMPANGSGPARLLVDGRPAVSEPAWSPDGRLLAYTGYENGVSQIMVLNLDSELSENRSHNGRHESSPSWCPDGNGLLFVMADPKGGGSQIGWMSATGERRRHQLTHEEGWNNAPHMSPDGSTVAFMGGQAGNPEIYLMNPKGGQRRRLTQDDAYDHAPRFSSDGKRLVFWSERNGGAELFTMEVDGGKLRRVLPKAQVLPGQFERDPAWVP